MSSSSAQLGTEKVSRLIVRLGWPAAINFLVIAVYNLTDVIFAGRWLGPMPIGAIVVVGTINFLYCAFGLAIGIGGSSIIGRALGEHHQGRAREVFANQNILVLAVSALIIVLGTVFEPPIIRLFGGMGAIYAPAQAYYRILLYGIPFISFSMMGNNVIQSEGRARRVLINSIVPAIVNIGLCPVFIKGFGLGIEGAAWATLSAYVVGAIMVASWFAGRKTEIGFGRLAFNLPIVKEISGIGATVLLNIAASNLFVVLLNKSLYKYQQEAGVVIYSIISRVSMIFQIPIIGIDGGIRPIIGYNFGSQRPDRIREAVSLAMKYGVLIGYALVAVVFVFAQPLTNFFTTDLHVASITLQAMRIVLSCVPFMVVEIVTVTYFQSIGKPQTAFLLTILRNILLLIPLLYILPSVFGYEGILYTFPIVDIVTTMVAFWLLRGELTVRLPKRVNQYKQNLS